jgi:hypothetical protein
MPSGRPKIQHAPVVDAKPILVSVYKLKPKPEIISQYYQFNFGPRDENYRVDSCPGCGNKIKTNANEHRCKGRLLEHPIKTRRFNQTTNIEVM